MKDRGREVVFLYAGQVSPRRVYSVHADVSGAIAERDHISIQSGDDDAHLATGIARLYAVR